MAVICKEAYFNSSTGKDKIRCLIWSDDEIEPIGAIQIVHGMWADVSLYKTFGNFFASCGFVVYANDQLGHGKTAGSPDKIGDLPDDFDIHIMNDIHTLQKIINKKHPNLPLFLFGDSSGCTINRAYCDRFFVDGIDGLIFCGIPHVSNTTINLVGKYFDFCINTLGIPANKRGNTFNGFRKFMKRQGDDDFKETESLIKIISQDKEYIKKRMSPDLWFPYTYRSWLYVAKIAQDGHEDNWVSEVPEGFPVLILSGNLDGVGRKGRFATKFAKKLEDAGVDCHVILYPNNSHDIVNTMDNDKALQDILRWLFSIING